MKEVHLAQSLEVCLINVRNLVTQETIYTEGLQPLKNSGETYTFEYPRS